MNENLPASRIIQSEFIWRLLRLPVGALMVCTLSMAQFHHNCGAGYRWFENYGAYFAAVVVLVSIMAFRRAVIAVAVAALVTLVFDFAVGPVYIKWVHSPYAPPFSGVRSRLKYWKTSGESMK